MTNRLAGALIAGALAVGLLLGAAATILGRDTATPAWEDRSASMMGGGGMGGGMGRGSMGGGSMGGGSMGGMMGGGSMGGMMGGGSMSPELHQSHHAQPSSDPTP